MKYFAENIAYLSQVDVPLSRAVKKMSHKFAPFFSEPTQSGTNTYGVYIDNDSDPQKKYFHSRVDPVREADRLSANYATTNSLIHIGLGSARYIERLLANQTLEQLIIIEPSLLACATLFQNESFATVLQNPQFKILSTEDFHSETPYDSFLFKTAQYLQSELIPLLTPRINVHCLHNRRCFQGEIIDAVESLCADILAQKASDHSVMQHLGQQWQRNIIWNASLSPSGDLYAHTQHLHKEKAILLGAGPSVEPYMHTKELNTHEYCTAVTDSVLPYCMKKKQKIDMVCSIDAQAYSYLHGNAGYPLNALYVSSLSSYTPAYLKKFSVNHMFIAGPHPLEQYLLVQNQDLLKLPIYGTSVISFTLLVLKLLGVQEVRSYGCDFCYPRGKRYCRDTYNYIYDFRLSNRQHSIEQHSFSRLVQEKAQIEHHHSVPIYAIDKLSTYKKEFLSLLSSLFEQQDSIMQEASARFRRLSEQQFVHSQDFYETLSGAESELADLTLSKQINVQDAAVRACIPFAVSMLSRRQPDSVETNSLDSQLPYRDLVDGMLHSALQKTKDYISSALSDT